MNTRNRPGLHTSPQLAASRRPYGLGTSARVLQARVRPSVLSSQGLSLNLDVMPNPACSTDTGRPCRHPLTNELENQRLLAHELVVKGSFDKIVQVLKRIAGLQHEADFEQRAQAIALEQLGFELPAQILADAWVADLDRCASKR